MGVVKDRTVEEQPAFMKVVGSIGGGVDIYAKYDTG